jgi:transposase
MGSSARSRRKEEWTMDVLITRCAGLDVHKKEVTACVRIPGDGPTRHQEIRRFGTTTRQLALLRTWLAGAAVTTVGMESTGVYWRPVYYALEADFDCWLLNAAHMHNVPGRKTDQADAAWIAQLVEHGLVRPSFVPEPAFRELRMLTRTRKRFSDDRIRHVLRLQAVLEDAGIKLASVATDVMGVSGRSMVEALIAGDRDPERVADLARTALRRKIPDLAEALEGRFLDHHARLAREALHHCDAATASVARLSERITELLAPWSTQRRLLETIPGVSTLTAEAILAEVGPHISRFPTAAHLASWAGVCPGNNESAGKRRSGRTRKGNQWLRRALVQAAHAAGRTKTYLGAQYARLRARRGAGKAALAVAHSILVIAYHVLRDHKPYTDLGPDWFHQRRDPANYQAYLVRKLTSLGLQVTVAPTA